METQQETSKEETSQELEADKFEKEEYDLLKPTIVWNDAEDFDIMGSYL